MNPSVRAAHSRLPFLHLYFVTRCPRRSPQTLHPLSSSSSSSRYQIQASLTVFCGLCARVSGCQSRSSEPGPANVFIMRNVTSTPPLRESQLLPTRSLPTTCFRFEFEPNFFVHALSVSVVYAGKPVGTVVFRPKRSDLSCVKPHHQTAASARVLVPRSQVAFILLDWLR